MEGKRIFDALQKDAALPEIAAKSGFLQWVLGLPPDVSPKSEAMRVLQGLPDQGLTPSAEAIRGYLQDCLLGVYAQQSRRRRKLQ